MKPLLGSCYYPEHWPEAIWRDDAKRMVDAGLSIVRIGEFAWSRLEPAPDKFDWQWLDKSIEVLGDAGLKIVLCTPTATPPIWMLERYPDMLAVDEQGRPRKFGSRRHYCFSHQAYRQESVRIAELVAQRYADAAGLEAWQIDNEYGCHDTVISYSDSARKAFRDWLANKYATVAELNTAWGNMFWSMEYATFEQIDLPNLTVTEPNPAHVLDFRRFSSDQVVAYNRLQADAIRKYSKAPLIHNYMGRITEFDHYKVGDDLDIASWDSYPLGFLEDRSGAEEEWKVRFHRQGDPDFQAFHHDLYRAVGKGRWWVMEQQPGPVNWAPHNPAPLPGMVRLWTWEAIAHQAEAVCYFRWRQAPFAQEQMHAGLLRPDSKEAETFAEVCQVSSELEQVGDVIPAKAKVALVFDYESDWAWQTQPQGQSFDYFDLVLSFYQGLRRLGLSVDIVPPTVTDLDGYCLVVVPGLMHWDHSLKLALQNYSGTLLIGPRAGSKTTDFSIPENLPPNLPATISDLNIRVRYVESLRAGADRKLRDGGVVHTWLESMETDNQVIEALESGESVLVASENAYYLAAWPDQQAMQRILTGLCEKADVKTTEMPEGLRITQTQSHRFVINYNDHDVTFEGEAIEAAGVRWSPL